MITYITKEVAETVHWLTALAVLSRTQVWFSAPTWWRPPVTSDGIKHSYGVQTYM